MTTLRETLARAIAQERDLGPGDRSWNRQNEDYATAVLRALATWEPSDAVVRAAIDACGMSQRVRLRHTPYAPIMVRAALREMAEEGS